MSPVKEFVGHTKGTLVCQKVVHMSSEVGLLNLFPPSLSLSHLAVNII